MTTRNYISWLTQQMSRVWATDRVRFSDTICCDSSARALLLAVRIRLTQIYFEFYEQLRGRPSQVILLHTSACKYWRHAPWPAPDQAAPRRGAISVAKIPAQSAIGSAKSTEAAGFKPHQLANPLTCSRSCAAICSCATASGAAASAVRRPAYRRTAAGAAFERPAVNS